MSKQFEGFCQRWPIDWVLSNGLLTSVVDAVASKWPSISLWPFVVPVLLVQLVLYDDRLPVVLVCSLQPSIPLQTIDRDSHKPFPCEQLLHDIDASMQPSQSDYPSSALDSDALWLAIYQRPIDGWLCFRDSRDSFGSAAAANGSAFVVVP